MIYNLLQMILKKIIYPVLILAGFISCHCVEKRISLEKYPQIVPDYKNINIPYNIAPLNFTWENNNLQAALTSKNGNLIVKGKHTISFPLEKFKNLLEQNKDDTIWVTVSSYSKDSLITYKPFFWKVEKAPIDSFLTYRLIEPGYEVYNKIVIAQRNVTNFTETPIADNNLVGYGCMNCHIPNKYKPYQSFFHIRGTKGMTVIADGKKLRAINPKLKDAYSSMIYGNWSPSGRYIVFSNNAVLPSTHSIHNERAFVYDTLSDIVVLDIDKDEVLISKLLMQKDVLETFPEFSADGTRIFYCSAKKVRLPEEHDKLQYSICSVGFDEATGNFGSKTNTLFNAPALNGSASELKASPDGKYLAFCSFRFGTFALWQNDARIYLYNIATGTIDTLPELNNNTNYSNSYHSWSTNSRWLAFASKRDNGLYGKIYFSYIDDSGHAYKPFVLPQKDPEFYDYQLKSYNVPELMNWQVHFDAFDIEKLYNTVEPEPLHYRE